MGEYSSLPFTGDPANPGDAGNWIIGSFYSNFGPKRRASIYEKPPYWERIGDIGSGLFREALERHPLGEGSIPEIASLIATGQPTAIYGRSPSSGSITFATWERASSSSVQVTASPSACIRIAYQLFQAMEPSRKFNQMMQAHLPDVGLGSLHDMFRRRYSLIASTNLSNPMSQLLTKTITVEDVRGHMQAIKKIDEVASLIAKEVASAIEVLAGETQREGEKNRRTALHDAVKKAALEFGLDHYRNPSWVNEELHVDVTLSKTIDRRQHGFVSINSVSPDGGMHDLLHRRNIQESFRLLKPSKPSGDKLRLRWDGEGGVKRSRAAELKAA